jgi:ERCC4-type nuclease
VLFVDSRVGSGDLVLPLQRLGVPAEETTLSFGDAMFFGNGPEGEGSVRVGIEIKKIRDLMQSIQTGRLSGHQLSGLLQNYDVRILLVEGLWRPNADDGLLEFGKVIFEKQTERGQPMQGIVWFPAEFGQRRYLYAEVDKAIRTLCYKAGIYYIRTWDRNETAHAIRDEYSWWVDKEWREHRSHLGLHRVEDRALLTPPPLRQLVARDLPGIGDQKAAAVAHGTPEEPAHFKTTAEMIAAPVSEWVKIAGIGKTIAEKVWKKLREE